jgi:hypothetical protein
VEEAKTCCIGIQKRVPLSPAVVSVLIAPLSLSVDPTPLTAKIPLATTGVEAVRPPKSAETVCAWETKAPSSRTTERRRQIRVRTCRDTCFAGREKCSRRQQLSGGRGFNFDIPFAQKYDRFGETHFRRRLHGQCLAEAMARKSVVAAFLSCRGSLTDAHQDSSSSIGVPGRVHRFSLHTLQGRLLLNRFSFGLFLYLRKCKRLHIRQTP